MIYAKEKLEDLQWLDELLALYPKALKDKNPYLSELVAEIKTTRKRIQDNAYSVIHRQAVASSHVKVYDKEQRV